MITSLFPFTVKIATLIFLTLFTLGQANSEELKVDQEEGIASAEYSESVEYTASLKKSVLPIHPAEAPSSLFCFKAPTLDCTHGYHAVKDETGCYHCRQ